MGVNLETREEMKNKHGYFKGHDINWEMKIVRGPSNEVCVFERELKHMQRMVETFELRRAECIRMMQNIPAKYINPYRKSLEDMISDSTEAKK